MWMRLFKLDFASKIKRLRRMNKGHNVVQSAMGEIGEKESPPNTNKTKYGKWANYDGVAWCGIFVSWCYEKAGAPLEKIGFRFNGFAGCQTAVAHFKKTNQITTDPQQGDIVFFDWNGDGRYDHTGIYVRDLKNGDIQTIEGNTSMSNNSNGGNVMMRTRSKKVCLFVHPKVLNK